MSASAVAPYRIDVGNLAHFVPRNTLKHQVIKSRDLLNERKGQAKSFIVSSGGAVASPDKAEYPSVPYANKVEIDEPENSVIASDAPKINAATGKHLPPQLEAAINEFYGSRYDPNVPRKKTYKIPGLPPFTLAVRPYIDVVNAESNATVHIELDSLPEAKLEFPNHQNFLSLKFEWVGSQNGTVLRSIATGDLPKIKIEFAEKKFTDLSSITEWSISPANNTLQAYYHYTKLVSLILVKQTMVINFLDVIKLNINFTKFSNTVLQQFLRDRAFCQKLHFISKSIGISPLIPSNISKSDIEVVEIVFRALTEGQFINRQSSVVLPPIRFSRGEVTQPPFLRPGNFVFEVKDTKVVLLGIKISLGQTRITIPQAELKEQELISKVFKKPENKYTISLNALDHQIHYRFDDHCKKEEREKSDKLLQEFITELRDTESEESIEAFQSSLKNKVDSNEAQEIVQGWLKFTVSSAFKASKPSLNIENAHEYWSVDITWNDCGRVGFAKVDSSNGFISSHTPLSVMRLDSIELATKRLMNFQPSATEDINYRTIIIVNQIIKKLNKKLVVATIPAWLGDELVTFDLQAIEDYNIRKNLAVGTTLLATVNLAAEKQEDLLPKYFTLPKKKTTDDNKRTNNKS
jgi:hypothetical protein